MFSSIHHLIRLARAARVMSRHDALIPGELRAQLPPGTSVLIALARLRFPWEAKPELVVRSDNTEGERLAVALAALGPSYIKLGQFLATRADIIGGALADDLGELRDRLPPFPRKTAIAIVEQELGRPLDQIFTEFSEPIAAASIAQVHRARTVPDSFYPEGREVAVKVLRPGVEAQFADDLASFFWIAARAERHTPSIRRLRPTQVVQTLADSVKLEMDLRLEAAAMSEMAENVADDEGFRVPEVDWARTGQRVLTLEWVGGTPAGDVASLRAAGLDMKRLGTNIIQSFLRHAMRDGFFHADMHQGNLFVDPDGTLVAVDFGIMGRLDAKSRRIMAEILYGFVRRDYRRVAELHFEAGYVPEIKNVDDFAQALRSIGEPIFGRSARDLSMGKLLAQLFQVTEQFDMRTRPELILLQKTMVVIEGVARNFDPDHNIWESAEPVLKDWMMARFAPETRLQETADSLLRISRMLGQLPDMLGRAERVSVALGGALDSSGLKLHPASLEQLARSNRRGSRLFWALAGLLIGVCASFLLS
ncbi:MAG: 2-polyprenylphenol 6-hydroxylase [Parvibaculaceae bacterium]|nr:2-polyprenylphenol 6-hydroxylase [Parvibaculaceae bacterium]